MLADQDCIIEVSGFPQDLAQFQLDAMLEPLTRGGAEIHWQVPGQEALAVFGTKAQAATLLHGHAHSDLLRLRPASTVRTRGLELFAPARKANATVANRLITRSLGVRASCRTDRTKRSTTQKETYKPAAQDAWSDDDGSGGGGGEWGQGQGGEAGAGGQDAWDERGEAEPDGRAFDAEIANDDDW